MASFEAAAPDADPDRHTGGPDQLDVAGSGTDPNPNGCLRSRQLHLEPGGASGDLQAGELQLLEVGHYIGHPHAGVDRPWDSPRERDLAAVGWRLGRYLTVTVPPSTRMSGSFPRTEPDRGPPWNRPPRESDGRRLGQRPGGPWPPSPAGRSTPLRIWFSSSRAHLLSPHTRACLRQRHRSAGEPLMGCAVDLWSVAAEGGQEAFQDVDGHPGRR